MADKAWKQFERRVSEFFGGRRNPLSGGNGKHTRADVIHPTLFVECKQRKAHSVLRTWDEAADQAKAEGKIPVVALSEKGRPGFWILCKQTDFLAIALEMSVKHPTEGNDPETE
ncbi:MAG: hypothetical protein AVO35_13270 [Candidatus Aegiribacteria sp. MLS_C]|jgi:hypothetical protein|nr:MAG: hypothetical protein AVO35_13270 [Candidatus Aegiribacteria sp. MLS_C]